jgi:cyclomaltodextrinase
MIDRFKNGDANNDNPVKNPELADQANFNGGDFAGIIQCIKNDYFDSLGINTLWISPVNKTTNKAFKEWPEPHRYFSGYHGYWPVSSDETEPRFGSMQELQDLVILAHKHDIKVLMDFISNHVHEEHPYFQNHRDWFGKVDLENGEKNIRRWDEYRLTTWFDTFIPSFDYVRSEKALQTMTDNAVWWLKETGVDGFRHDATKHVPYKFWRTLTNKIKHRVDPNRRLNIYQVGETFGGDDLIKSYVNNGMLDAQFNFNQFFVARRIFVEKDGNFEDLSMAIEKSLEAYGYNHLMGNIMDSHDQVRMMALLEGDLSLSDNGTERAWHRPKIVVDDLETYKKEVVFLTYLLTVPGIPIIYYGDEFGMTGANDPDNRRMMRFADQLTENESQQLAHITQLIKLRKSHSSLRRGDFKTLFYDHDILAYTRGDNNERIIIVLNKGPKSRDIKFNLPEWMPCNKIKSLQSGKIIQVNENKVEIILNSYSANAFTVL